MDATRRQVQSNVQKSHGGHRRGPACSPLRGRSLAARLVAPRGPCHSRSEQRWRRSPPPSRPPPPPRRRVVLLVDRVLVAVQLGLKASDPRHVAAQLHRGAVVQAESRPPSNASAYWVPRVAINMRYARRWNLDYLLYAPGEGRTARARRAEDGRRVDARARDRARLFTLRRGARSPGEGDGSSTASTRRCCSFLAAALADRPERRAQALANPRAHAADRRWNLLELRRAGKAAAESHRHHVLQRHRWAGHILASLVVRPRCHRATTGRGSARATGTRGRGTRTCSRRRLRLQAARGDPDGGPHELLDQVGREDAAVDPLLGKRVPKKEKAPAEVKTSGSRRHFAEAPVGTQGGEPPAALPPGDAGVRAAVEPPPRASSPTRAPAPSRSARAPASAAAAAARASASFGSTRRRWRPSCSRRGGARPSRPSSRTTSTSTRRSRRS